MDEQVGHGRPAVETACSVGLAAIPAIAVRHRYSREAIKKSEPIATAVRMGDRKEWRSIFVEGFPRESIFDRREFSTRTHDVGSRCTGRREARQ
jgi:hypothetical protein